LKRKANYTRCVEPW